MPLRAAATVQVNTFTARQAAIHRIHLVLLSMGNCSVEVGGRLRRRLRITRGIPSASTVVVAVVVDRFLPSRDMS